MRSAGDLSPPCSSRCAGRASPGARALSTPPRWGGAGGLGARTGSFLAPKSRSRYLCAHGAPGRPAGVLLAAPRGGAWGRLRAAARRSAGARPLRVCRVSFLRSSTRAGRGRVGQMTAPRVARREWLSQTGGSCPGRRPGDPVLGFGPGRPAPPPAARRRRGGVGVSSREYRRCALQRLCRRDSAVPLAAIPRVISGVECRKNDIQVPDSWSVRKCRIRKSRGKKREHRRRLLARLICWIILNVAFFSTQFYSFRLYSVYFLYSLAQWLKRYSNR